MFRVQLAVSMVCIAGAAVVLAGCGGSSPLIGAPIATNQLDANAAHEPTGLTTTAQSLRAGRPPCGGSVLAIVTHKDKPPVVKSRQRLKLFSELWTSFYYHHSCSEFHVPAEARWTSSGGHLRGSRFLLSGSYEVVRFWAVKPAVYTVGAVKGSKSASISVTVQ